MVLAIPGIDRIFLHHPGANHTFTTADVLDIETDVKPLAGKCIEMGCKVLLLKCGAKEGKYGVGFFNAVNNEMARAIIETAEELHAPVMVGTAEVLLPATELELVANYLIPMAKKASVPVCVHYDHGLTFERCMEALKLGFTSIMYDCSTVSYEENVERVAEMVKICHAMGRLLRRRWVMWETMQGQENLQIRRITIQIRILHTIM